MGGIMSTLTCPADRGPTRNDGTTTNSKLEFDGVDLEAAYPPTHRTDNTKYEEGYKANAKQEHKCDHPIHKEVNISVTDPTMIRKCNCMEHSSENNGHGSNYVPQPSSINTVNHLPLTSEELKLHLGTDVSAPFKPILKILQVGPLDCNMTIIGDPETKNAIVVDPGGDAEYILDTIQEMGVNITRIYVTHGHFDHFLAAGELRKQLKVPIYLHAQDKILWNFLPIQLQMAKLTISRSTAEHIGNPDLWMEDGDDMGILDGKVIHTPGHSGGSCCFHFAQSRILIAGDTLFRGTVGRTDLMGGNNEVLTESILTKLYILPDSTYVITGHGPNTYIGHEKRNNGIIRAQL